MIEREVKMAAPRGFRLLDLGGVAADIVVTAAPERRFSTIYWDTPDLRLIRWGSTLRFRAGEGWTVKLPKGSADGMLTRAEHVFDAPQARPPTEALDLVTAFTRGSEVSRVARMRTVRRALTLRGADGRQLAEIDDDEVTVFDGRRVAARFREIEVEIPEGAPEQLLRALVDHLVAAGAQPPDPTPKLVRALGDPAAEPADVAVDGLPRKPAAGDVVRRAIAASVQRLIRHDAVVRIGADPEGVHQARVATRRLRSDLRTFAPLLDRTWSDALRAELTWLADELGAVRDGDVLLMRLRDTAKRLDRLDPQPIEEVIGELEADVERERARLLEGMRDPRYLTLLDDLVAAARAPMLTDEARRPAAQVLPQLVRRPWRRLRRAHAALSDPPRDEELHQVRIMAKRVRYAAEAVSPVAGRRATALASAAAGVQEVLGDLHDAVVAADWLRAHAGDTRDRTFATGALYAIEMAKTAEQRATWPKAWKKLDKPKLRDWM